ncbi:MAG: 16S rRNA (cytosine(1402)-N(4))-methyltransferase RsmH, partial [Angustibacter sp.]
MSNGSAADRHVPVMQSEVLHYLTPVLVPGSVLVDGTLGMGGHSQSLLTAAPGCTLIAIDRDQQALDLARDRLSVLPHSIHYRHCGYDRLAEVCRDVGHPRVQGILLDLGVSSLQLDEADRGFAYRIDAPLDMRMDTSVPGTAADLLNSRSAEELADIFRSYGEERYAGRIARAILRAREIAPLESSAQLVELIRGAIPAAARNH